MSANKGRYARAGKLIKEAQEYDLSAGDELGSFCKYLSCVKHIAEFLCEDAASHRDTLMLNRHGVKSVLVMAKKCLERAEDLFVDEIESKPFPTAAINQAAPPLPARNDNCALSTGDRKLNGPDHVPAVSQLHSVSPMVEARLKNQKLMSVYQEHLRKRASSLLPQDCNRLNMEMWKKIEQNNKIAKMKEKVLQQKLQERSSRMSKLPRMKTQLMVQHSVKEICELVAVFENSKGNFTSLRLSLQQHPDDHTHLYNLVNEVLSTAEHPLSKLLAECQFNVCESIKPLAMATSKGGDFPALSILRMSRHRNDPLPSLTISSSDDFTSSHSYSSTGSLLNERSQSLPEITGRDTARGSLTRLHQLHSTPSESASGIRTSTISQYNEEEDFVTSEVFMAEPVHSSTQHVDPMTHNSAIGAHKGANQMSPLLDVTPTHVHNADGHKDISCLNKEYKPETNVNEEAIYFILEKPPKLNNDANDKVTTPGYEQIDEAPLNDVEQAAPYETPRLSRQESADPYYSNIGSPEASGYTSLSQWTRTTAEDDYTLLDRSTVISKTSVEGDDGSANSMYPVLSCSVHLGKSEVLEPLSEKVSLSIKEIVREIHLYLDKMEQVFVMTYQGMSVESNKETCRDIVEKIFFPPIWPNLVQLYRCCNYQQEVALASNMSRYLNSLPCDLSVREQFQLLESANLPYLSAIEEIKKITDANSPSPKLEILVTISHHICQAIEEYYSEKGQQHADSSVGVDDMLPIFCYIILRSGLPQMVSECSIMDEFIQEGYLMGEEGFCLTSFQTALRYLTTMSS